MNLFEVRFFFVDRVEGSNGRFGLDDELINVVIRGELEEVEGFDGVGFDIGDVFESFDDIFVFGVDDEGIFFLFVFFVFYFIFIGFDFFRVGNFGDVGVGSDSFEEFDGSFGFFGGFDGRGEDEGDFLDLFDFVVLGEDKGGESRGSEGRSNGVLLLVLVYFDVLFFLGFGRGEYLIVLVYVIECGLVGLLGIIIVNMGDMCNGMIGILGFGRGLVIGVFSNGVSLLMVFGDRFCYFFLWLEIVFVLFFFIFF